MELHPPRYVLFKAEKRMSPEEKQRLIEIVEADEQIGRLRAFLGGVRNIFEDSQDEEQARAALDSLKQMPRGSGRFNRLASIWRRWYPRES